MDTVKDVGVEVMAAFTKSSDRYRVAHMWAVVETSYCRETEGAQQAKCSSADTSSL